MSAKQREDARHVIPQMGRKHVAESACWCVPVRQCVEGGVREDVRVVYVHRLPS